MKFHEQTRIDPAKLMNLVSRTRGAQFTPAGVLQVPLDGQPTPGAVLQFVRERLAELRA
jgi:transcription-repair coupling factor (superfamily II helicase)